MGAVSALGENVAAFSAALQAGECGIRPIQLVDRSKLRFQNAAEVPDFQPENAEAASLLLKVGERMAWDAEAATTDGAPERASELVQTCLELVPDHARCLEVAGSGP